MHLSLSLSLSLIFIIKSVMNGYDQCNNVYINSDAESVVISIRVCNSVFIRTDFSCRHYVISFDDPLPSGHAPLPCRCVCASSGRHSQGGTGHPLVHIVPVSYTHLTLPTNREV